MITHKKQWEFLKGKFEAGQLGHAYLLSGQEGIGKKEFAKEFIKLINNGVIPGLDLVIEKEQFPDLLVIKSINSKSSMDNEKDMMEIDVAQIREVNNFLSYKSYYGGYKAVIIENAERMNQEAQSCFLKTLEEPKGKTIIFLISSRAEMMLATVFSRCQTIKFFSNRTYQATAHDQKMLQELLPILTGDLAIKFQYTKKVNLEGNNINIIMEALQRYFRNMMLAKIGVATAGRGAPSESSKKPISESPYSMVKLKNIIQLAQSLHTKMLTTNTSPKLALEILLLEL